MNAPFKAPQSAGPAKLSIVKESRGQWAVVDWTRGGATAAINTIALFSTERDAKRAMPRLQAAAAAGDL